MVVAMTPLPVIGVTCQDVDIVWDRCIVCTTVYQLQLTVAIGNVTNVGLLAIHILSTSRYDLRQQIIHYPTEMKGTVKEASAKLIHFVIHF
jgi:phosphoribosylcarboxyaminoimidazole (NCAIR) mutase